jgi:general secretion pathway protein E
MGIEPYLLASSVLGVIAQRLVRRICSDCKISYTSSLEELAELKLPAVEQTIWKGVGCEKCFHSGYKGRVGIYELMLLTPQIKRQVLQSQDAEELRKVACSEGMLSLFSQGVELVLQGITTSAEVLRVTRFMEE